MTDQESRKPKSDQPPEPSSADFPRDGGNAALRDDDQTLNGLRSLLGLVRPH